MRSIAAIALLLAGATIAPAGAQTVPYQHTPLPAWAPPAYAPNSRPNLTLNPPPANWQGQWRPEYGTMIMPPWDDRARR